MKLLKSSEEQERDARNHQRLTEYSIRDKVSWWAFDRRGSCLCDTYNLASEFNYRSFYFRSANGE